MEQEKPMWKVEFVRKEELKEKLLVQPEAQKVITAAKPKDLLILATYNNSPEQIIIAKEYSMPNLKEIVRFAEEKQAKGETI
jgi:hypothetical protein